MQLLLTGAAQRSGPPSIIPVNRVYAVASNIIALQIETGVRQPGSLAPYTPQAGDVVGSGPSLTRDGLRIGDLVGPDQDWLRTYDRLSGPKVSTDWASRETRYAVLGDFGRIAPLAVHRKSKPVRMIELGGYKFDYFMRHTIYLVLPANMQSGQDYEVRFKGQFINATFTYDPTSLRSEAVHASHIGFAPDDPSKVAFLSTWMGSGGPLDYPSGLTYWLINHATGGISHTGQLSLAKSRTQNEDEVNGTAGKNYTGADVWMADFSSFSAPGTYRVAVDGIGCSYPFEIAADVWSDATYISARGFYHQRSGIALGSPHTTYTRPRPYHPADGMVIEKSTFKLIEAELYGGDVFTGLPAGRTGVAHSGAWGGWFDAGDWDRRSYHMDSSRLMLELYEMWPAYFGALVLDLPESGNGLPDIINEALWCIDLFKRLQEPSGGVSGGIEATEHPRVLEPSWLESLEVFTFAPCCWASYDYAAAAAKAARILQPLNSTLAASYQSSAIAAWDWAETDYLNYNSPPLPKLLHRRMLAAAELYRLTASAAYQTIFLDTATLIEGGTPFAFKNIWERRTPVEREAIFTYALTPHAGINSAAKSTAIAACLAFADQTIELINATGFKWHKNRYAPMGFGDSNGHPDTIDLIRAHWLSGSTTYLRYAILGTQFSLGANPENLCFTTGIGPNPVKDAWIYDVLATGSEMPPGITVYGPADFSNYSNYFTPEFFNFVYPNPYTWPIGETYFDVARCYICTEFTVPDTMGAALYTWGYLAGKQAAPIDYPVLDSTNAISQSTLWAVRPDIFAKDSLQNAPTFTNAVRDAQGLQISAFGGSATWPSPDLSRIDQNDAFSFIFWGAIPSRESFGGIFSILKSGHTDILALKIEDDGYNNNRIHIEWRQNAPDPWLHYGPVSERYEVYFGYETSPAFWVITVQNGDIKTFKDGTLIGTKSITDNGVKMPVAAHTNNYICVGRRHASGGASTTIKDAKLIALCDRALSQAEITSLSANPAQLFV